MNEFPILNFFSYKHLPSSLQDICKPFHDMAHEITRRYFLRTSAGESVDISETVTGLRKLLESKDCIVRSMVE